MSRTDEQLICEYQKSRSAAALKELVVRHTEIVRNLAYRMTLCNAAADDVTQEVFMRIMRYADAYRGRAKFSTWLYRIAINASKEYLRRRPV